MTLLFEVDDAEYFAFSDQDDIWHEDKLITAVERIKYASLKQPTLYCGNQDIVTADETRVNIFNV